MNLLYPKSNKQITLPIEQAGTVYIDKIKLTRIENFITHDECKSLIELAGDNFTHSTVYKNQKRGIDNISRTSRTCHITENELTIRIKEKVSQLVNKPINCIEKLQIVKYEPGQFFVAHNDSFPLEYVLKNNNQRQYTILLYLNDDFSGGETDFPKLELSFTPKTGDALFWENCSNMRSFHIEALHSGKTVTNGIKYAINIWINFNEYIPPNVDINKILEPDVKKIDNQTIL